MKKLRSDSTFSRLKPEQRQQLENWLFDDGLGYKETKARVLLEFGLACSISSLERFYRRGRAGQSMTALAESLKTAKAVKYTPQKEWALRGSSSLMIGQRLLAATMEPGNTAEVATLGRLMLQSELRELQWRKFMLAQDKYHFNAMEALKKIEPLLEGLQEEADKREDKRLEAIRRSLFGDAIDHPCEPK
jgi:hypothetical protein